MPLLDCAGTGSSISPDLIGGRTYLVGQRDPVYSPQEQTERPQEAEPPPGEARDDQGRHNENHKDRGGKRHAEEHEAQEADGAPVSGRGEVVLGDASAAAVVKDEEPTQDG